MKLGNISDHSGICVFLESVDCGAKKSSLELLGAAKKLANVTGEALIAIVIGSDTAVAAKDAEQYGADRIYVVEGPGYEKYNLISYTNAISVIAENYKPSSMIFSATDMGRELAPRVACRVKTGLTADCIDICYNAANECMDWICPAFGGQLIVTIECPDKRPQMGTVRPGMFPLQDPISDHTAEIISLDIAIPTEAVNADIIDVTPIQTDASGLETAEVIIAGGRGMCTAEKMQYLYELAELLNGKVAASRVPVEFGWVDEELMIGHSGKNINAKLYIACGISGMIQHVAGVKADLMIAINNDPDAPIFTVADIGIIADATEFVPELIRAIKIYKAKHCQ
jgi:electron transfer flavoprotein alpha subunit